VHVSRRNFVCMSHLLCVVAHRFSGLKANIKNLVDGGLMDDVQHAWWTTFLNDQESTDWAGKAGVPIFSFEQGKTRNHFGIRANVSYQCQNLQPITWIELKGQGELRTTRIRNCFWFYRYCSPGFIRHALTIEYFRFYRPRDALPPSTAAIRWPGGTGL